MIAAVNKSIIQNPMQLMTIRKQDAYQICQILVHQAK